MQLSHQKRQNSLSSQQVPQKHKILTRNNSAAIRQNPHQNMVQQQQLARGLTPQPYSQQLQQGPQQIRGYVQPQAIANMNKPPIDYQRQGSISLCKQQQNQNINQFKQQQQLIQRIPQQFVQSNNLQIQNNNNYQSTTQNFNTNGKDQISQYVSRTTASPTNLNAISFQQNSLFTQQQQPSYNSINNNQQNIIQYQQQQQQQQQIQQNQIQQYQEIQQQHNQQANQNMLQDYQEHVAAAEQPQQSQKILNTQNPVMQSQNHNLQNLVPCQQPTISIQHVFQSPPKKIIVHKSSRNASISPSQIQQQQPIVVRRVEQRSISPQQNQYIVYQNQQQIQPQQQNLYPQFQQQIPQDKLLTSIVNNNLQNNFDGTQTMTSTKSYHYDQGTSNVKNLIEQSQNAIKTEFSPIPIDIKKQSPVKSILKNKDNNLSSQRCATEGDAIIINNNNTVYDYNQSSDFKLNKFNEQNQQLTDRFNKLFKKVDDSENNIRKMNHSQRNGSVDFSNQSSGLKKYPFCKTEIYNEHLNDFNIQGPVAYKLDPESADLDQKEQEQIQEVLPKDEHNRVIYPTELSPLKEKKLDNSPISLHQEKKLASGSKKLNQKENSISLSASKNSDSQRQRLSSYSHQKLNSYSKQLNFLQDMAQSKNTNLPNMYKHGLNNQTKSQVNIQNGQDINNLIDQVSQSKQQIDSLVQDSFKKQNRYMDQNANKKLKYNGSGQIQLFSRLNMQDSKKLHNQKQQCSTIKEQNDSQSYGAGVENSFLQQSNISSNLAISERTENRIYNSTIKQSKNDSNQNSTLPTQRKSSYKNFYNGNTVSSSISQQTSMFQSDQNNQNQLQQQHYITPSKLLNSDDINSNDINNNINNNNYQQGDYIKISDLSGSQQKFNRSEQSFQKPVLQYSEYENQ